MALLSFVQSPISSSASASASASSSIQCLELGPLSRPWTFLTTIAHKKHPRISTSSSFPPCHIASHLSSTHPPLPPPTPPHCLPHATPNALPAPFEQPCFIGVEHAGEQVPSSALRFPSMPEIYGVAESRGVRLELRSFGPSFRVTARNLEHEELGRAQGFVRLWTDGRILHLDSIRMNRLTTKCKSSVFGIGLLMGAVMVRYGYDCKCTKAELLAINDSDTYHSKLVRYYTRMGFKAVHEVTGGSLQDVLHMLAWGGVGTRMDASLIDLLRKWSPVFQRQNYSRSRDQ